MSLKRSVIAFVLMLAFVVPTAPVRAASTGQIQGTVIDATTKAPVPGASISVVSPVDRYTATSDVRGNFAVVGVTLDTYTIAVEKAGYDAYALQGATITADEAYRVAIALTKTFKTVARVRARSIASAFQPTQTVDRYTLNAPAIDQLLGKSFNVDQTKLLGELPGVTVDQNGTPLIRGGLDFQTGFQFEGIDYTEPTPSLANRFQFLGNSSLLNGVGSLEIIPGGGDATHGNTGTGLIALTAKRGSFPGTGTFDYEIDAIGGGHQLAFEYGLGSPNQRVSNYLTFIANDRYFQFGPYGTDAASIYADPSVDDPSLVSNYGATQRRLFTTGFFDRSKQTSRDFIDNFVYKFGKSNAQSLQFFTQLQAVHQDLNYGGFDGVSTVPLIETNVFPNPSALSYLGDPRFVTKFFPLPVGGDAGRPLTSPESIDSPFASYKFEYTNNLSANATVAARYFFTGSSQSETLPSQGLSVPSSGGDRHGIATDATLIASSKHTLQLGGSYAFVDPFGQRDNTIDYNRAYDGLYEIGSAGVTNAGARTHDIFADFVQPTPTTTAIVGGQTVVLSGTPGYGCLGVAPGPIVPAPPQEHCGYLSRFFPGGLPRLPSERETPTAREQVYALYLQDTFAPNARLRFLAGLRLDGFNFLLPDDPQNPPAVDGVRHQRLYEPHVGASLRLGDADSIRVNFGRTLAIPLATFLGNNIDRSNFAAFERVPSFDSVTGKAATYCGPGKAAIVAGQQTFIGSQTCTSYADQLYWLQRNARFADQAQITSPLRGATFTNYDLSYAHEFKNRTALKLTPFYRRGYDIVEQTRTLLAIDPATGAQTLSPELSSNLGLQKALGVEFALTSPPVASGLSGQISATYINQIGNDPPGAYLPTASVQLGNLYHTPNLAPLQLTTALTYKTKSGFKINPIFTFKSGYPYGVGIYQAFTINGQAYYVPYTDALFPGAFSNVLSSAAVNPQNPGTFANPNIAASTGAEAAYAGPGSLRSKPTLNTDLVLEFSPPLGHQHGLTYGVSITNLFDRVVNVPVRNFTSDCQLVYTGLCASDGTPSVADPSHAKQSTIGNASGPYFYSPNQQPIQTRFYVQASF